MPKRPKPRKSATPTSSVSTVIEPGSRAEAILRLQSGTHAFAAAVAELKRGKIRDRQALGRALREVTAAIVQLDRSALPALERLVAETGDDPDGFLQMTQGIADLAKAVTSGDQAPAPHGRQLH